MNFNDVFIRKFITKQEDLDKFKCNTEKEWTFVMEIE